MKDYIIINEHPSNKEMRKKIIDKCRNQTNDWAFSNNTPGEKRRINAMLRLYGLKKPSPRKIKRMEKRLGKKVIFKYD